MPISHSGLLFWGHPVVKVQWIRCIPLDTDKCQD